MDQYGAGRGMLILAVTIGVIAGGWRTIGGRDSDQRLLRLELIVFRGLEKYQIDMVRREVDTIWAAQSVRIDWSRGDSTGSVRVLIDRSSSMLPRAGRDEQWSVAATRVVAGQVSGPIYVALDAAERVVRAASPPYSTPALAGIMVTRVVGRAIAHELAHFLLNTRTHGRRGLLRASFRADDFVQPGQDGFTLDAEQLVTARQHDTLMILPQ